MKHTCAAALTSHPAASSPAAAAHSCRARYRYLSKEMQAQQTPFAHYISPTLLEVQAERQERAMLGTGQPYNRQIP